MNVISGYAPKAESTCPTRLPVSLITPLSTISLTYPSCRPPEYPIIGKTNLMKVFFHFNGRRRVSGGELSFNRPNSIFKMHIACQCHSCRSYVWFFIRMFVHTIFFTSNMNVQMFSKTTRWITTALRTFSHK